MTETSTPGLPKYRHVANVLRERIRSGDLAPGAPFPPEPELEAEFGYHRGTIRQAIAVLRREGLLDVVHGRGTYVRRKRLIRRNIVEGLRYEYHAIDGPPPPDLFQAITGTAGDVTVTTTYEVTKADARLAETFGVTVGAKMLRRNYLFFVDGAPHQIADSYLLYDMVDGTILTDPANEAPNRGTMRQLADIDVRVDYVTVDVQTRPVAPAELAVLDMPEGLPVFAMHRVMLAEGRAVEVCRTVAAGDRLILEFSVKLGSPQ